MRRQGGNGLRNEIAQVNAVASRFAAESDCLARQAEHERTTDNLT